jgi:hypothetical protein
MLADDAKSYAAIYQGATIARNGATACPIDADRIAFFAREAQVLDHPLPTDWRAESIVARSLDGPQATPFAVTLVDNRVTVAVPARCPVIVYRNAGVIKGMIHDDAV